MDQLILGLTVLLMLVGALVVVGISWWFIKNNWRYWLQQLQLWLEARFGFEFHWLDTRGVRFDRELASELRVEQRTGVVTVSDSIRQQYTPLAGTPIGELAAGGFLNFRAEPGGYGVFGGSGGGKGNLTKVLVVNALLQGCLVWVIDHKGYVDYARYKSLRSVRFWREDPGQGYVDTVAEMQRRLDLFFEKEVENIEVWNEEHPDEQLPFILVVMDEIANVAESAELKQHRPLVRKILAEGRAAGIIPVAITQYPTAELLPRAAQVNILHRFVFRLPSSAYTPVALGLYGNDPAPPLDPSVFSAPGMGVYKNPQGDMDVIQITHMTRKLEGQYIEQLKKNQPDLTKAEKSGTIESTNLTATN